MATAEGGKGQNNSGAEEIATPKETPDESNLSKDNQAVENQTATLNLKKELEEERKKTQELTKRMMYLQADILNLQKQYEKRELQARENTSLKYLLQLALLLEDLERALSAAGEGSPQALKDGLSMLISRIDSDLRSESVERIKVEAGSHFDPRIHEAVAYKSVDGKSDGCILSVISNGYTFKGKVIKPSLVEVARQARPADEKAEQTVSTENLTRKIHVSSGEAKIHHQEKKE